MQHRVVSILAGAAVATTAASPAERAAIESQLQRASSASAAVPDRCISS